MDGDTSGSFRRRQSRSPAGEGGQRAFQILPAEWKNKVLADMKVPC